ncbi:chaperonin 10-like protein [Cerioporus squamosus]|nr:chaperonin 10-like protein [Cerioporus squamosus]
MSNNPSFVLRKVQDVVFEDRPIPEIKDDEVLVAVKKTGMSLRLLMIGLLGLTRTVLGLPGICGSDVHFLVHGHIGHVAVKQPMVLGHESAGIVHKIGKNVKNLREGDRVAMEPGPTCRVCEDCKRGRYEICPDIKFAATPPYDGTLAR